MYRMKVTLWKPSDKEGRSRETTTDEGFYGEPTPIDCVNALVYEIRGDKSDWELAYVDEIEEVSSTENDDTETPDTPTCDHRSHTEDVPAVAKYERCFMDGVPAIEIWTCPEHELDGPADYRINTDESTTTEDQQK